MRTLDAVTDCRPPPKLIIEFELERSPRILTTALTDAERDRLYDWLSTMPVLGEVLEQLAEWVEPA